MLFFGRANAVGPFLLAALGFGFSLVARGAPGGSRLWIGTGLWMLAVAALMLGTSSNGHWPFG